MALQWRTCERCGNEFELGDARRIIGRRFGAGCYNDFFPDGNVCEDCAREELGTAEAEGAEIMSCRPYEDWD